MARISERFIGQPTTSKGAAYVEIAAKTQRQARRTAMRRLRQSLRRLKRGVAGTQHDIGVISHSWGQSPNRWAQEYTKTLQAEFGNAGSGYCACSYPAAGLSYLFAGARSDLYTVAQAGGAGWTSSHYGQTTPNMGRVSSSTAGNKYTWTGPAGHGPANGGATFYYGAQAGSEVRYRWSGDAGVTWSAWTNRTLDGGRSFTLNGMPATAFILEVEVVAGTCRFGGVQFRKAGNGIRVHNLASSGSQSNQWVSMSAVTWQAAIADLGIRSFIVHLDVNEPFAGITPDMFAANLQTLITRLRTASADCDVLLVASPQVPLTAPPASLWPQSDYAAKMEALALSNGCDFYDLSWDFGTDVTQYQAGTALDLIDADLAHPSVPNGEFLNVDAMLRASGYPLNLTAG